jgi:hypothetical protein
MKYHLNVFTDESEATKYPNSVSVLYCVNGDLIIGDTYRNTIPLKLLKKYIKIVKMLLGDDIEAIIKVNH